MWHTGELKMSDRESIVDDIVSVWYELEESYDTDDELQDRDTLSEYSDEQLLNEWEIAKKQWRLAHD